jgi:hypothetical protein
VSCDKNDDRPRGLADELDGAGDADADAKAGTAEAPAGTVESVALAAADDDSDAAAEVDASTSADMAPLAAEDSLRTLLPGEVEGDTRFMKVDRRPEPERASGTWAEVGLAPAAAAAVDA